MLLEEIGSGRSDCGWKAARAEASLTAQIQMALDAWVSERATSEKMTGAAAYISFGGPRPGDRGVCRKSGCRSTGSSGAPEHTFPENFVSRFK